MGDIDFLCLVLSMFCLNGCFLCASVPAFLFPQQTYDSRCARIELHPGPYRLHYAINRLTGGDSFVGGDPFVGVDSFQDIMVEMKSLICDIPGFVRIRNPCGETPLLYLVKKYGYRGFRRSDDVLKIARFLIEHHASVDDYDVFCLNVAYYACVNENKNFLSLLIEKGADLDAPVGPGKTTLLEEARFFGLTEIVELLVDAQAGVGKSVDKQHA